MDVDSRHLRAFVAVCDEGTFTDAGIALHTTQASVSRSVQRLETTLGVRLLVRSSRSVDLTPAGERVLGHARRALGLLGQLADAATGESRLRLGYAWAALGEHTVTVQRGWDAGDGELVLVHTNTASAGLLEGRCEVAVVRTPVTDPRLESTVVGVEQRYAAVAADDPLAARASVRLTDLVSRTVASDAASGTTGPDLWPDGVDVRFVPTTSVEEWLTLVASGRAVGVTPYATAVQHARAGVAFVPVADAAPVEVRLAWWYDDPPAALGVLVRAGRSAYGSDGG